MATEVKSSRYVGVCRIANEDYWGAKISVNGRRYDLGEFTSEFDAAVAYDQAANAIGREGNFAAGAIAGYRPMRTEASHSQATRRSDAEVLAEIRAAALGAAAPRVSGAAYIQRHVVESVLTAVCEPDALLTRRQIQSLLGVAKSSVTRWIYKVSFPEPDDAGRYRWDSVRQWLLDNADGNARDLVAA